MLFFDLLRGRDSTGVFGVDKHCNVDIHKEASHAVDFIAHDKFKEFKNFLLTKAMFAVGHNRAATRGAISDKNAHPFWEQDKIVLVQNGTYRGSHKHIKDTEVDTEAIAHVLAEEADVEAALKKVNAAYALVWFNTETKTLNLIRNNERPLWLLETKSGGLVWASEANFIYMAALRNGLAYEGRAVEIPAFTLVSLTIEGKNWVREDKLLKCDYTFPVQHYQRNNSVWEGYGNTEYDAVDSYDGIETSVTRASRRLSLAYNQSRVNRDDVEQTANEVIIVNFPEYICTPAEGIEATEEVNKLDKSKKHIIEVLDYVAANKNPLCQTWHIIGQFVQVDENNPAFKVVCHWFMYQTSEADVKAYCDHGWYKGRIANTRMGTYNDKKTIVSVLMNELEALAIQQTHVA